MWERIEAGPSIRAASVLNPLNHLSRSPILSYVCRAILNKFCCNLRKSNKRNQKDGSMVKSTMTLISEAKQGL